MSVVVFWNTLISVFVLGSIFALVTLGFVIVYRASHVFNFMHPQFMLIGALLFTTLGGGASGASIGSFAVALIVSMAVVSALGGVLYALVVHRSAQQPHWVQMIMTMGLGIAAVNVAQLLWGANPRFPSLPMETTVWSLPGGGTLNSLDFVVFLSGVILNLLMLWLLTGSKLGIRLKATSENPALSAYSGVRLLLWFSVAWALAAAAAVFAAVMYSSRIPLDPAIADIGLLMFPAAMMGGMDSVKGAFVGAFILAAIRQFGTTLLGAEVATPIAFSLVLLVLVFRPRGLFGSPVVERV